MIGNIAKPQTRPGNQLPFALPRSTSFEQNMLDMASVHVRKGEYRLAMGNFVVLAGGGSKEASAMMYSMIQILRENSSAMNEIIDYCKELVKRGSVPETALNVLGYISCLGFSGTEKNYAQALEYYQLAREKGSLTAMRQIGILYSLGGYGINRDVDQAHHYFELAVEKGDLPSLVYSAKLYRLEKKDALAVESLKTAVEKDNVEALYLLGNYYANGFCGLVKNDSLALAYLRKADAGHFSKAKKSILVMCLDGRAIQVDIKFAVRYMEKYLDQSGRALDDIEYKLVEAKYVETARYYAAMLGSKSDDPNCKISDFSAELLRHEKSDKNGSAFSPYYLGCLYQLGICPDKTAVDIYRCFKRSFQRGYVDARLKMLEMASNDSVIKSDRVYLCMVLEGAVHQGDARASELLANPLFANK